MEQKTVLAGNTRYAYYEVANPGKPKMLFLHGMMVESHCFEKVAGHLAPDFHLFLLDLKGHGKSDDGSSYDESYGNAVIGSELQEIHAKIIGEPCHMVGYSLGGQHTLRFTGLHPELIRSAVLIDSAPDVSLRGLLAIVWAIMTTPRHFRSKEHVLAHYNRRLPGLGEYMFAWCMREVEGGGYRIRYDQKRLAPDTVAKSKLRVADFWAAARQVTRPLLVLRAMQSTVLNNRMERMLKASSPTIEFAHLEGMRHNLVFSHPREVADRIRDFANRA